METVIVAFFSAAGVVVAAYFGYLAQRKAKGLEVEVGYHQKSFAFSKLLQYWPVVLADIEKLMDQTEVDRFLILRACNGMTTPKVTTAIYQMRQGSQEPISYVNFQLDDAYRKILNNSKEGPVVLVSDEMKDSYLKDVYMCEGVKGAFFGYIHSQELGGGSVAHTYCTFATHEGPLTQETATRCRVILDRLCGLAS